jgi:hypothetical protein
MDNFGGNHRFCLTAGTHYYQLLRFLQNTTLADPSQLDEVLTEI